MWVECSGVYFKKEESKQVIPVPCAHHIVEFLLYSLFVTSAASTSSMLGSEMENQDKSDTKKCTNYKRNVS